jgi:DNA-binding LytR/AlgR family response regulator
MPARKIACLAVDDEPLALAVLQKYIATIPALELAGSCGDAVEALGILQRQPVDLIFLDIQMPFIMGTDFIRTLKKSPKIIFTTAYREYAIEGFELDAVDYLLKPISFERFMKAINKVLQTEMHPTDSAYYAKELIPESSSSCLYVRSDRRMVKVFLNDIYYIEGMNDYVKIITTGKTIITKQLISSLEETLPKDGFIRIHRSFIVATNKIESYSNDAVQLGKAELPIGRNFKQNVYEYLKMSSVSQANGNKGIKK